ncbi:MAG TPA: hypothetical protein VMK84_36215 [Streptosporangiaceae bacterium]|nr:hypothetical protein [Streptosporangiaceae bacterium]
MGLFVPDLVAGVAITVMAVLRTVQSATVPATTALASCSGSKRRSDASARWPDHPWNLS